MKKQFSKTTSIAVGAIMIAAALATAAPAGALDSYDPELAPTAAPAAKVAVADVATYRPASHAKHTTRTKKHTHKATRTHRTAKTTHRAKASTTTHKSELEQAQTILNGLIAQHPILKGTTVEFGDAHGYQAVAYYSTGRIVISASHTASLKRILYHEAWHVIDFRDNGKIDWGENVPR